MSAAFKRLTGCRAYLEYGMVPHGDRYQYQGSIEWMMCDFIKKNSYWRNIYDNHKIIEASD